MQYSKKSSLKTKEIANEVQVVVGEKSLIISAVMLVRLLAMDCQARWLGF